MSKDWNERATTDAIHYIATTFPHGPLDLSRFFSEGSQQAEDLIRPVITKLGFDPKGKRILDIGCGIGRQFPGFVKIGFGEIWGIDCSSTMIELAEKLCSSGNAQFLVGNGMDLSGLGNDSFDYCFSYTVFQHIPSREIIGRYIFEVRRVLKGGGIFHLHLRSHYPPLLTLVRLMPEGIRERLWVTLRSLRLGVPAINVPGRLDTWHGAPIRKGAALRMLGELGFADISVLPDFTHDSTRYWVIGRKPHRS
jgi:SAM-dependent methyltransferase